MSKNFSCCELIERIKTSGSWKFWKEKDKYLAVEFLDKSTTRHVPDRVSDTGKVITKYESIFCENCRKWFDEQRKKQDEILDNWIEDLKSKGELEKEFVKSSSGVVEKGTVVDEVAKNLEKSLKEKEEKDLMNDTRPFERSP